MLGLKKPGMIMGPHSFRRNAITDTVNATNGNFELVSLLYGNSAKVAKNNYYIGYDKQIALDALNKRKFFV